MKPNELPESHEVTPEVAKTPQRPIKFMLDQKPFDTVPMPWERGVGWIKYLDLVFYLVVDDHGKPYFCAGCISQGTGRAERREADDIKKTIVNRHKGHDPVPSGLINPKDRIFDVRDPCLIRRDEISILKRVALDEWFKNKSYSPETLEQIRSLLSKPYLGIKGEISEEDTQHRSRDALGLPSYFERSKFEDE